MAELSDPGVIDPAVTLDIANRAAQLAFDLMEQAPEQAELYARIATGAALASLANHASDLLMWYRQV